MGNDGGIHIRGGRTTEVSYVVDGIRVTDDYDTENKDILLESFGEKIASKILQNYPAQSLTLKISKKKIIPDADFVGIILNRSI